MYRSSTVHVQLHFGSNHANKNLQLVVKMDCVYGAAALGAGGGACECGVAPPRRRQLGRKSVSTPLGERIATS
jgi:hypothetical protein